MSAVAIAPSLNPDLCYFISVSGEAREICPLDPAGFKLRELYGLLSCSVVEMIMLDRRRVMIMDEEGKLNRRPINMEATKLACTLPYDVIVGDVIVCPEEMFQ